MSPESLWFKKKLHIFLYMFRDEMGLEARKPSNVSLTECRLLSYETRPLSFQIFNLSLCLSFPPLCVCVCLKP